MELPIQFKERMQKLLGESYADYVASFALPKYQGLRINTLKLSIADWHTYNPFSSLTPVPWCETGYYYTEDKPTKHPYYYAGLYYIQEPSAMAPGAYLPIALGDRVLDLCAAPGGKSTQLAAKLQNTGVLVSNDISTSRAKALVKNLENCGTRNVIITNESPERLATKCAGYFNKIIIDAPCSGEGMFKKDEAAIKNWRPDGYVPYMTLQDDILNHAASMLAPDGMILYSTCTFVPEENEGTIARFLTTHEDFSVVPLTPVGGIVSGVPAWGADNTALTGSLRLWPHHLAGEGHFLCLLKHNGSSVPSSRTVGKSQTLNDFPVAADFFKSHTNLPTDVAVVAHKEKLYLLPEVHPDVAGLRVMRSGMYLGEMKNKRFEPSHVIPLAYPKAAFKNTISWPADSVEIKKYLKGETLYAELDNGYAVVCVDDFPLGWVKVQNTLLKNQFPAAWRMMG